MTEAKQHDLWNYASSVMALLANLNRDPKKGRALKPADFHPRNLAAVHRRESLPIKADLSVLKTVFVDNRPGGNS